MRNRIQGEEALFLFTPIYNNIDEVYDQIQTSSKQMNGNVAHPWLSFPLNFLAWNNEAVKPK